MFAASRKDRVSGRTVTLTDSISTRNGFSQVGAPSGKKWAMNIIGNFVSDDRIIVIHRGNPRINVKIRCLDELNIYGLNPIKLIRTRRINNVLTIVVKPLIIIIFVRNSWSIITFIKIMVI